MEPARLSDQRKATILRLLEEERESRKRAAKQGADYQINWETLQPAKLTSNVSTKASFAEMSSRPPHRQASKYEFKSLSASVSPAASPRRSSLSLPSTVSSPLWLQSAPASRASPRTREMDVERIRREVERNWTFRPNSHPCLRRSEGQLDPVDVISLDWQEKVDRLSTPRTQIYAERERLKAIQEEAAVQQCSFHPVISLSQPRTGTIDHRLFEDAIARAKERQRSQALHEEYKAAECTFQPRIHSPTGRTPNPPIYQRLTEIVRRREAELESLKQKIAEEEKELKSYRPVIGRKSEALAEKYYGGDGEREVVGRMESQHQLSEWRKTLLIQSRDREEMRKCPFSPRLSPVASPVAHRHQIAQKIAQLAANNDDLAYSFHPLVDSKSELMVNKKQKSEDLSWAQRLQLLSRPDIAKHSKVSHQVHADFKASHPFEPKLVSNPQYRDTAPKYRIGARRNSEKAPCDKPQVSELRLSLRSQYARKASAAPAHSERLGNYGKPGFVRGEQARKGYSSTAPSTPRSHPSRLSLHLP